MKRLIYLLLILLPLTSFAQQATISGSTQVNPGAWESYSASFPYYHPYSIISWSVSGGTIVYSDQYSCQVQWDNINGTGSISVYEDLYGQYGELSVQIGSALPSIYPTQQETNYGTSPYPLEIGFNYPPSGWVTYQWQEWNGAAWNDLPGQTAQTFWPPVVTGYKKYKCIVNHNGTVYEFESEVQIPAFTAGTIYQPGTVNYNTVITGMYTQPATGGYCTTSSYQYVWEQSVEDGPWTVVGTTQAYPATTPIIGKTKIRRKVTCGAQTLYSSTLEVNPQYTPVDWENRTYVREITVLKPGIVSWQQADQLPIGEKLQTTTYLDGGGRPVQTVDKGVSLTGTNTWNDLVKHYEYNSLTEARDYLPYATADAPGKYKTNAATAQAAFIRAFFNEPATASTYHVIKDENFRNQPVTQAMAGAGWGGSSITASVTYDFNDVTEQVHIWDLDYTSTAIPTSSATLIYPTGKLSKMITQDEKGAKVITYTDPGGKVILKKVQRETGTALTGQHAGWDCTYYIYDDFGQLRFILTPKVVNYLDNNSWTLTTSLIDELCYVYQYDAWGRVSMKKQPGAGENRMVYDVRDRLVFTQDANQRQQNQWVTTLYDPIDRPAITGLMTYTGSVQELQSYVTTTTADPLPPPSGTPTDIVINTFSSNNHIATQSITMETGFESGTEFTAEIWNSGSSTANQNTELEGVVINKSPLPPAATFIPLHITYYDHYNFTGVKSYQTGSVLAYDPANSPAESSTVSNRVTGFVTGEKTRVLDGDTNPANDLFLYATTYYDDKGRVLQVLSDNHKGGIEYQTSQYDFSGKLLSTYTNHYIQSGATYTITAKQEYDKIGRLTKLSKNFNNTVYKPLAEYSYNELGQLKEKRLAPGYGGTELEKQVFSYNIQGWLTGINKDHALSTDNYSQWQRYFSLYLGYENRDGAFAGAQYNGQLTGTIWRTQGDNTPRKYDYTYDRLGRLQTALFKQKKKPSETAWSSADMDFSVYVDYADGNGNIASLKQLGVVPGTVGGIVMDDLRYTYKEVAGIPGLRGNQLQGVEDLGSLGSRNGILGDFKDGNAGVDYSYDLAGNLTKDLNKGLHNNGAEGITYNYLNKPIKMVLHNKSIVEYTYTATGEKLSKKVTQMPANTSVTTNYIGDFIYEETALQYILHEEGRVKVITPVSTTNRELNAGTAGIALPNGKQGTFEYFIKDHLSNTRMVLTEEVQQEWYRATMEQSAAAVEEPLFGKVNADGTIPTDNELKRTRIQNSSPATAAWPNHANDFVKLTAAEPGKQVGPNVMLKVMAGDMIRTTAKYYYRFNNSTGGTVNPVNTVVTSLLNALLSPGTPAGMGKSYSAEVNSGLTGDPMLQQWINTTQPTTGNTSAPKAYINVVFLDEQFRFIEKDNATPSIGTAFERVSQNDNPDAAFGVLQQKAPKNGWVYVYLSNESNEPVYFDDFQVAHEHSRIAQESHYYPHGLKIAALSSKAFNKLETKYGYQGDYSEEEVETGYNEFYLRSYDPQIGRWTGVDPYDEFPSPYVGMGNDPVNTVDPDGGMTGGGWGTLAGAIIGGVGGYLAARENGASVGTSLLAGLGGAFIGAGVGYGVGQSLSEHTGFGVNTRAFYEGFFGGGNGATNPLGNSLRGGVIPPNVWGWIPEFRWIPEWTNMPISFSGDFAGNFGKELVRQLHIMTGLDLRISGNRLQYQQTSLVMRSRSSDAGTTLLRTTNVNRGGTSGIARRFLLNSIAQGYMSNLSVGLTSGTSSGGGSSIILNPATDIEGAQRSLGLNPLSWGLGMVFLHEMGHTRFGGNLLDLPPGKPNFISPGITPGQYTGPGTVERTVLNRIRRQLGPSFGQRMTYLEYENGYIPFDRKALRALNSKSPQLPKGSLWIKY